MRFKIKWDSPAALLMYRWEYIKEEKRKVLTEKAQQHLGKHYGELRAGEFFACMRGDFSVVVDTTTSWAKVTQAQYIWCMGFAEYLTQFGDMLARLVPPMTAEQKAAAQSCLRVSFEESVLVFCQQFFGLHNLREAEYITINEYLIAKRDRYNAAIFEKKLGDIQRLKAKAK